MDDNGQEQYKTSGNTTFDFYTEHSQQSIKNMKKKRNWFTSIDNDIFLLIWGENCTGGENFHVKPTEYFITEDESRSSPKQEEHWSTGLYNLTGISYKLGYLK